MTDPVLELGTFIFEKCLYFIRTTTAPNQLLLKRGWWQWKNNKIGKNIEIGADIRIKVSKSQKYFLGNSIAQKTNEILDKILL